MTNLIDAVDHATRGSSLLTSEMHHPGARQLTVARVEHLGSTMRRVVLTGGDLEPDFPWRRLAVADHVKIVLPDPRTGELAMPVPGQGLAGLREYTIRRFDPQARELTLDFVVHPHGPAGRWAMAARPGSKLGVLGPRGSRIYPADCISYLLVADESGLPAVERFCGELPKFAPVHVIAAVESDTHRVLSHASRADIRWIVRGEHVVSDVVHAIAQMPLPHGAFAWGGGEVGIMAAVRRHLLDERGFDRDHVDVRGYWRIGEAGPEPRER